MNARFTLLILALLAGATPANAQPALERLERQLEAPREQQPTKEQGYLGLITRNDPGGNFIRVVQVVPESPAALAGIQTDDVLLSVDGRLTRAMNDLATALQGRLPGDRLALALMRGQEERTVNVTLSRRAPAAEGPALIAPQAAAAPQANPPADRVRQPPPAAPLAEAVAPPRTANSGDAARIDLLERRMAELERRLAELERLLSRRP